MLEVIRFELKYRFRRPATYIYFFLMLVLSFLFVATDAVRASGGGGKVMDNAPAQIAIIMLLMMWIGLLISSAIMGVPVLRDYEHATSSMIFTTPIKKWQYLSGRYIGSFVVLVLIISGVLIGLMVGLSNASWPWLDQPHKLLAFNAWHFIHPFLVIILPGLFFFGSLFFAAGALGKKMIVVYAQAVIAFMGYLISTNLLGQLDNRNIGAMLDPIGINTYAVLTQYWTVVERNSQVVPLEGVMLYNRLLWIGVGVIALILTFWKFSFQSNKSRRSKKAVTDSVDNAIDTIIPATHPRYGWQTSLLQIIDLSWFYFKWVVKQMPFLFITLAGIIFVFIIGLQPGGGGYDIDTFATTSTVVQKITAGFGLFFVILLVFYSGELIWKERDVKINLIYDAMPFKDFVSMAGKYLGYQMVHVMLILILILCGILIQLIKGNNEIELGLYLSSLFGRIFINMALFSLMAFFLQVMVNQKFLGFAAMVVFFISLGVLGNLGVEHSLLIFGSGSLGTFSEMNKFGHYIAPFSWFNVYWTGFVMILFAASVLFSVRGSEALFKTRLKVGLLRLNKPLLTFIFLAFITFISSGFYIYYNTNVENEYVNSEDQELQQANYEKDLKQYERVAQPKITETKLTVEIYPFTRDFTAKGYYTLKNKTADPMPTVHIQDNVGSDFKTKVTIANTTVKERFDNYKYTIYEFNSPLQPGEEVRLDFEVDYKTKGFKEGGSNTQVVYNGTFFNNTYFPSIGYNSGLELGDDDDRREHGLEVKERMLERDDPVGLAQSLFGDDADKITFEVTVGTDSSQIAIAPGYLQKQWKEGDRAYFSYKMDVPMVNFYNIVSADYSVKRDLWKAPVDSLSDVNLEIYYHKGHEANLDRMMSGLKKSMDYYTANFSPFQFRQLRIMEFPGYSSFAQSFANTIPFAETIGFVQEITEKDVDLPFYVTAHEVAHQWWGHQVTEAGVKGNAMLSETMSQYSALMVMKNNMPEEQVRRFLKYELNTYLIGRSFEQKKELPIEFVEGQGYIHYRKGSLLMYALQDYISEDSVNAALKRFNKEWAFKEGIYPTSKDLIGYFDEVTPDSLKYLLDDFFRTITLYENKAEEATYRELDNGKYEVDLTLTSIKYRADSLGNEESIQFADYIDVGVFKQDEEGEEKLIYLKKHKISKEETKITVTVDEKPYSAGIDPIIKLIDRNPEDNVKTLDEAEDSEGSENARISAN